MTLDRTPKPCLHKRANHQHGTYAAYVLDTCRCGDCRQANSDYEHARHRRNAAAAFDPSYARLVDAEPVREHLRRLSSGGMGWKRVARAAGVANGTMYPILYGRGGTDPVEHRPVRKRVTREVADRILAVRLDVADGMSVDGIGCTRRLQALVTVGYSQRYLAERLGVLNTNLSPLVLGDRRKVFERTRRQITELYVELAAAPGPSTRARNDAARKGWLAPVWWDDDAIDDRTVRPAGVPPEIREARAAAARRRAERLLRAGRSRKDVCRVVHLGRSTVSAIAAQLVAA